MEEKLPGLRRESGKYYATTRKRPSFGGIHIFRWWNGGESKEEDDDAYVCVTYDLIMMIWFITYLLLLLSLLWL